MIPNKPATSKIKKKNTSKPPHFALFWNLTTPDMEQSSSRAFNALKLLLNNVYTTGKSQL
ncbi:hypothetical protein Peur_039182 [Populus x canadensis]